MFRWDMCVVLFAFVQAAWGLKCYQCDEQTDSLIPIRDPSCVDPRGQNAHSQVCSPNEVCVKYKTPDLKDLAGPSSVQITSRFCGNKDGCKLKDERFDGQLKEFKEQMQGLNRIVEELTQFAELEAAQKHELEKAQEILKSLKDLQGECYTCTTELCNSASTVFPSVLVSVLLIVKYCLF